jgi:hypothetical protein
MNPCVEEPRLRWIKQAKTWQLEDPVCWLHDGALIQVPVGFCTDLASIPFPLNAIHPRSGHHHHRAAIVHDYLYYFAGLIPDGDYVFTRKESDRIFYDIMRHDGVPAWRAYLMWLAVRSYPLNWGKFSRKT